VLVGSPSELADVVGQLAKTRLAFAQRLLGLDLFRNICVGTEPADDIAHFVSDRQGTREKPAVAAVCATQRKGVFPRRPAFKTFSDAPDDAVDMLRVVYLLPTPTLHVFKSRTGIVMPSFVIPVNPAVLVGGPGELADVVGE